MRSPVVRDRFFATLIGPAGGTAVKSGVDRLDLDLIHQGSASALRVAGSLKDGVPHLLVRIVSAEAEGQKVERVLFEGLFAEAHRRSALEMAAGALVTAWYAGEGMDVVGAEMEALRSVLGLEYLPPRCEECGALIPNTPGGGLANRHHEESCSLFDAQEE